jgi:hypothetical protein
MPESLWQGWSRKGRTVAAALLKIPIEGVLPTTNHLESFNCLLKRKYLPRWQRSGVRIRFDFLIHILVSRILPEIYSLRRSQSEYLSWLSHRFHEGAGGVDLVKQASRVNGNPDSERRVHTGAGIYWFEADKTRDGEAIIIVNFGRISDVQPSPLLDHVEATCASTSANLADPSHVKYKLSMHRSGRASCTCLDFKIRGGACKHLRALRLVVITWAQKGFIQHFYHPTTLQEGLHLKTTSALAQSDINPNSTSLLNNLFTLKELAGNDEEKEGGNGGWESDGSIVALQDFQARHLVYFGQQDTDDKHTYVQDLISMGRDAVPAQTHQRIQQTVLALLPRLHGLSQAFSDITTLSSTPDLIEFRDVVSSLAERLRMIIVDTQSTVTIPDRPSSPTVPRIRRTPPSIPVLLPPSPEPRQKRKTSHDTM